MSQNNNNNKKINYNPISPRKVTYICEKSSMVTKVKEIIVLIRLKSKYFATIKKNPSKQM